MERLFGIPMEWLAAVTASAALLMLVLMALMALRNPVLVKLGLRSVPRRGAQTVLIVLGLMLGTMIIAASLGVGDTITYSIRQQALTSLGHTDQIVRTRLARPFGTEYFAFERYERLRQQLAGDERIDGLMPELQERLPVVNSRTQRTDARMRVSGLDPEAMEGFGELRTVMGEPVEMSALGSGTAYLNEHAAAELEAVPGDELLVVGSRAQHAVYVRAILQLGGVAGDEPRLLLPLAAMQEIIERPGQINRIHVSNRGDELAGAKLSDEVTRDLRLRFTDPEVASDIHEQLRDDDVIAAIEAHAQTLPEIGGHRLQALAAELRRPLAGHEFRVLIADAGVSGAVAVALEQAGRLDVMAGLSPLLARLQTLRVDQVKVDALDAAREIGGGVTTIFVVLGSFSILVGVLLIFLIFVLLAAARRTEMGMARAIGTKRRQLVQVFAFEGTVYALGAAAVGTGMGLLASVALVQLIPQDTGAGSFVIHRNVEPRSVVVAFSSGFILTLLTVAASAYRVSKLNIVAAIRGLEESGLQSQPPTLRRRFSQLSRTLRYPLAASLPLLGGAGRRAGAGARSVATGVRTRGALDMASDAAAGARQWYRHRQTERNRRRLDAQRARLRSLAGPPPMEHRARAGRLGWSRDDGSISGSVPRIGRRAAGAALAWMGALWSAAWQAFAPFVVQGWPVLIAGTVLALVGMNLPLASLFMTGVSLGIIGTGLMVRWGCIARNLSAESASRISFTFTGILLLGFWSLPFSLLERFTGDLAIGIEIFILAGVAMVAAAVWMVMYNTQVLVWLLNHTAGRHAGMRPVFKIAIAYPLAARMRTGLTLAMFSLIIFTLMVFAILTNTQQVALDRIDNVTGGYEISASLRGGITGDVRTAIAAAPELDPDEFEIVAGYTNLPAQVRQFDAADRTWRNITVRAVDETFLETNRYVFSHYDPRYGTTPAEIWQAVGDDPSLAVLNSGALPTRAQARFLLLADRFTAEGIFQEDPAHIEAFTLELRDPAGARPAIERTVIGVTDQLADFFSTSPRLITGPEIASELMTRRVPITNYDFRLAEGVDARDVAARLQTAFLASSLEADVNETRVREQVSLGQSFNRLFQSFMGLGLIVGVASLGVISVRAVVERRSAIGTLRAIGYKERMIEASFLIESSFVALLGTALGLGLGAIVSWNVVGTFGYQVEGLRFAIPWLNVAIIVLVAYGFSLLTTFWPARQASKTYPAEALRYE